jgi:hypothetical protein
MDEQHRNIFIRQVLSYLQLSEKSNPQAALIVRGIAPLGIGFSSGIGAGYVTSSIFEAVLQYQTLKIKTEEDEPTYLFATYFPSLEEFRALYSTDIRTIYYLGDITDKNTVKFLNETICPFKIIKVEINENNF